MIVTVPFLVIILKFAYLLFYINKIVFTYQVMSTTMWREKLHQNVVIINSSPSVPTTKGCVFYVNFCFSVGTAPVE